MSDEIKPLIPSETGREIRDLLRLVAESISVPVMPPAAPPTSGFEPRLVEAYWGKHAAHP